MSRTKEASKRKIRRKAVPVLSVAGVSLAMAGTASATANEPATDTWSQNTSPHHEIFLGEEEISDVSLATFYVFDKENAGTTRSAPNNCQGLRRLQSLQSM